MALVRCVECGRDVSDKASACPACGAPVDAENTVPAPSKVSLKGDFFVGTRRLIIDLAAAAIEGLNYRIDGRDDTGGTISFTTGVTMGSWSGVSGTLTLREVEPYVFELNGQAKQNVKGGQLVALDLFNEANGKVQAITAEMRRRLAIQSNVDRPAIPSRQETSSTDYTPIIMAIAIFGAAALIISVLS